MHNLLFVSVASAVPVVQEGQHDDGDDHDARQNVEKSACSRGHDYLREVKAAEEVLHRGF